jgi:hypothetical protein
VELGDVGRGASGGAGDVRGDPLSGLDVADRQGHGRAGPGERSGRLDADSGGGTGHDGGPSPEVEPRHDLGGGGVGSEGGEVTVRHGVLVSGDGGAQDTVPST